MGEVSSMDKAKQIFAAEHRGWRIRNGRLRPVAALAVYFGILCLFGVIGALPVSNNTILNPDGAGAIDSLLLVIALGHGLWAAIVWRQWSRVEDAVKWTEPLMKSGLTILLFFLGIYVCHSAWTRGAPLASTYVWGTQQSIDVRIDSVRPTRSHGACSNKLVLGIARRDYVMTLSGSRWSNRTLCVNDYDGEVLPSGASWLNGKWITMTGQGNWLAFRMEHYQMQ